MTQPATGRARAKAEAWREGGVRDRCAPARGCRVRAIVRSAEDQGSYERLSYAVGAESLQGEIEAPWILRDTSEGGPLFNSPAVNRSRK